MNTPKSTGSRPTAFRRIFIAVDASSASQQAVAYVRNFVPPGAQVCLASVADDPRMLIPTARLTESEVDSGRMELLNDATNAVAEASDLFARGDVQVETSVIERSKQGRDLAYALIDAARTWQADLLVVGSRQHQGLLRWLEGSVSDSLATHSTCPILIVPASYEGEAGVPPQRILFAVDGSSQAIEALQYGAQFATPTTDLRAIYVVDRAAHLAELLPSRILEEVFVKESKIVLAAADRVLASATGPWTTATLNTERSGDDVAHAIVREAARWHADLLVMGTHGRRGVARWLLGSVASRVARVIETPLLLVSTRTR